MRTRITEFELRTNTGRFIRAVKQGECFVITRGGQDVAELSPMRAGQFIPAEVALAAFASAPPLDRERFRRDVDI